MSASDVCAEGSETPRLQAAGKVPTVAAQGSRAPRGAATPSTQSNPPTRPPYDMGSPGIRRPMPGEGQKGDTHGGERYRPEKPTRRAQRREHTTGGSRPRRNGGAAATVRHGAARPAASNGNKRQRPNPRPDLKRGRDDDGRASAGGATPGHTELIEENKRRLHPPRSREDHALRLVVALARGGACRTRVPSGLRTENMQARVSESPREHGTRRRAKQATKHFHPRA